MVETILARTPLCIVAPVGWPAIVGYRQRLAAVYAALRDGILGALDAASPCEGVCFFGEERTLKPVMEVGHWQLSGVAFSVASAGTACLIGPELPSLVASARRTDRPETAHKPPTERTNHDEQTHIRRLGFDGPGN